MSLLFTILVDGSFYQVSTFIMFTSADYLSKNSPIKHLEYSKLYPEFWKFSVGGDPRTLCSGSPKIFLGVKDQPCTFLKNGDNMVLEKMMK